nr:PKD domain-containing protein [Candidatus Sigynarchaeota archaeon]
MPNRYSYELSFNNNISSNIITNNSQTGLKVSGVNTTVSGNTMNKNGLELLNCSSDYIFSHSIDESNTVNSRPLRVLFNQTGINLASISNAGQLVLINCNDSVISGLNVSDGTIGFIMIRSKNNTIWGNDASNNTKFGISLEAASDDNKIYLNGFASNSWSEALVNASTGNAWDNGSRGNYWGDYTGRYPGASNDGAVWNISYQINTTTDYDHFPLVSKPSLDVKPVAAFSVNASTIIAGQSVQFTFTGFGGNEPSNYQWDFGDGTTNGTTENPTHQYTTAGTFTVVLSVTDMDGDSNSVTQINCITVAGDLIPSAAFTGTPTSIIAGQLVTFTHSGSNGDTPTAYQWDFGDGTSNGTTENPVHQYSTAGTFTVILTITDADGDTNKMTLTNYITVVPDLVPTVSFSANVSQIVTGQSISFTFGGMQGNTPTTFNWTFGDGSPSSNTTNPTHQFVTPGNFMVQLTLMDADGDTSTTSHQIEVLAPLLPPGPLALSSDAGNPDEDGLFTLTWNASARAVNYTIYVHSSPITTINASVMVLASGLVNNSFLTARPSNGSYYFVVVAINEAGNTTSNCITVRVLIPGEPYGIDPIIKFFQDYGLYMAIGGIGAVIVGGVVVSRKKKNAVAKARKTQSITATKALNKNFGEYKTEPAVQQPSTKMPVVTMPPQVQPTGNAIARFLCPSCKQYHDIENPNMETWYSCPTCGAMLQFIKTCPHCNQPIALTKEQYEYYKNQSLECWNCKNKVEMGLDKISG